MGREEVAEKTLEVTAEASTEATKASVEDTADLRAKVFDALMGACQTGRLSELLKDVSSQDGDRLEQADQNNHSTQKLSETMMVVEADAPSQPRLDVTARSKRHAELLGRQRMLGEMNKKYEEQLSRLKEGNMSKSWAPPAPPAPPTVPRPKRPGRSIKNSPAFRELCEVNTSLCNENARLNAELARLLMRAGQHESKAQT